MSSHLPKLHLCFRDFLGLFPPLTDYSMLAVLFVVAWYNVHNSFFLIMYFLINFREEGTRIET